VAQIILFDGFELNLEQQTLTGPEGPISLRPQTYAVLCHLIEKAPGVVSQDKLLDEVWGHQATSVSSVAQTIKELRNALGDSSSDPKFITTRRRMGYQFIAEIERRDTSAVPLEEAAAASPISPEGNDQPVAERWLSRPWALMGVIALFVLLAAVWRLQPTAPVPAERLPTLAIGDMVNSSADPELNWLSPALETYLGHALVELGGFRVLATDRSGDGSESEADFLIDGQYLSAGVDGARLLAQLRRPGSNEIITSLESNDSDWDVAGLSVDLATAIRDHLGFNAPAQADASAITARLPSRADTQRAYFRARAAFDALDFDQAMAAVDTGLALQSDSPPLVMLKAQALSALGNIQAARSLSEQALAATRLWPRRDRLELEATAAMLDFEFDRAADRLQALTQFYPEPTNSRRLIHALIQSGRLNAAREGLASLKLMQPDDARLALLGAELARVERKHDERLEQAAEARRLAEASNSPSLIVAARLAEADALIRTGQLDTAEATLQALVDDSLPVTESDRTQARLSLARIEFQRGNFDSALDLAEQVQGRFETLSHPEGLADTHMLRASIFDRTGRVDEAIEQMNLAQSELETLNDPRRLAQAGVLFGVTLMRSGRFDEAEANLTRAASYFRSVNDRQGEGAALINQATLLARNDRMTDAEPVFQRALEAFEDAGDLRGQAIVLGNLAAIAGRRKDVSRSIELAEESLSLFELIGAQTDIARVTFNLGILYRDQGDLLQAESNMRRATDAFAEQGAHQMQLRSGSTLARLLVNMGRGEDANPILEQLEAIPVEDIAGRSVIDVVRGHRALIESDIDTAIRHFEDALAKAETADSESARITAQIGRAQAELAREQWVLAEQLAREILTYAGEIRDRSREADALLILARARLEQGRSEQAEQDLARVDDILAEAPDTLQSLQLGLVRSRLGGADIQRQHLDWVIDQAERVGYAPLARQAKQRLTALPD
jgi:DNA-binding winged helix-turn-helix (wHTH) protein/tetratricopeptide (TPR) repeat protein